MKKRWTVVIGTASGAIGAILIHMAEAFNLVANIINAFNK